MDKVKVLSLMLHAADISHPAKTWSLHHAWTHNLMEEFFRQGDKEMQLGLPFSPLCDRKATMIGQSQIGFIDFIVEPTFSILVDASEKVMQPLIEEESLARESGHRRSSLTGSGSVTVESVQRHSSGRHGNGEDGQTDFSLAAVDLPSLRRRLSGLISSNKERWKELSTQETAKKEPDGSPCRGEPSDSTEVSSSGPDGRHEPHSHAAAPALENTTWNGGGPDDDVIGDA
ncbi:hypothetical protein CRUP_030794 [Coryphaenoides rupestris]|nr:hypothetical protein CRUP_030794 [Coryphaenoides rupestris]